MAFANSISGLTSYNYIVNGAASGPLGTIQQAINMAHSDGATTAIFIRPGTYTENLTLYSGINLQGSQEGQVIIVGTHTPPAAGTLAITNCQLQSATDILSSAAAGTTAITISSCTFNITNGYVFNLANWTGELAFDNCSDISAANNVVTNSGGAALEIFNSNIGSGTTGMAISGITTIFNSRIYCPITASSAAVVDIDSGSTIDGSITISGTATLDIYNSRIASGTNPCITTTSSELTTLENVILDSSATNVIAGTGQIELGSVTYNDVSVIANTITFSNLSEFSASNVNIENILFLNGNAGTAGQVLTSNGVAAPTWQAGGGGGFTWQGSTGTTMVANNGYIATGNAVRTFTVPATAAVGDTYSVVSWGGYGASNGWLINCADPTHATLTLGTQNTSGSLSSTTQGDAITLVCIYAAAGSYAWMATSSIGNISVS